MRKILVFISLALLSGCDTVYQPMGWDGGYEDKQLADKHYWIMYQGNSTTPDEWVQQSWQRRASELCAHGYKITKLQGILNHQAADLTELALKKRNPVMTGEIQCLSL